MRCPACHDVPKVPLAQGTKCPDDMPLRVKLPYNQHMLQGMTWGCLANLLYISFVFLDIVLHDTTLRCLSPSCSLYITWNNVAAFHCGASHAKHITYHKLLSEQTNALHKCTNIEKPPRWPSTSNAPTPQSQTNMVHSSLWIWTYIAIAFGRVTIFLPRSDDPTDADATQQSGSDMYQITQYHIPERDQPKQFEHLGPLLGLPF